MKDKTTFRETRQLAITFVILIAASILNDYLLEDLLFPDNEFSFINKFFTALELVFLTFSIKVLLTLKALGFLFTVIRGKETKLESEGLAKDVRKMSWPIIPGMIIYGLLWGIIIRISTTGYSFLTCIPRATLLSCFWGLIYWVLWRRRYLLWFYDFQYSEDPERPERYE